MVSFFLPIWFPSLNDYIDEHRKHRMAGANMKKQYTDEVARVLEYMRVEKIKAPVTISFEWHEKNSRRDPDNVIFAKKFILDGMVQAGVIVNDTQRYILGIEETWLVDPANVGVSVNVQEYDND